MRAIRVAALLTAGLLAALPSPSAATSGLVAACVDRNLAQLKPTKVDIQVVGDYAAVCAEMLRLEHGSDAEITANEVMANQRFNTNVLLWMVVLITIAGVTLAGIQLMWTYRLALSGKGDMPGASETTISEHSLVVKSSIVGVTILGFSLVFFVVFVIYVYPITLVGGKAGGGALKGGALITTTPAAAVAAAAAPTSAPHAPGKATAASASSD